MLKMYDIADDNWRPNDQDNSDDECEILEEKVNRPIKPEIKCFASIMAPIRRSSVIAGRKRPATDSQSSSREATGFKQPALQVIDKVDSPIPVPMTSESLVQASTSSTALLLGRSSQLLPQVPDYSIQESHSCLVRQSIPTTVSISNNGTECPHLQSSYFSPICGCSSLARPIPMRPSSLMTFYPAQSSISSGELSTSNGLDTNPSQPSSSPQPINDFSTIASPSFSQLFQSRVPSPFLRAQCVPGSTLLSLIATSSCTSPVTNSSPPPTTPPQEASEQPQPSTSLVNTVSSVTQTSQESNSCMQGGSPALDLSLSLQESSNPATILERRPIWQGTVHYEEKGMNLSDPNVSHYLACTFSNLSEKNGVTNSEVNLWPSQMQLSLIASEILKEKNMLEVLKKAAHPVKINFHEESHVLKRIKRNMNYGWMGCVQFTIPNDVRIIIFLYMPDKNVFVGFVPHEQRVFFQTFRHVYEKKRRLRNIQKELLAKNCQSESSGASSVGNEPIRNQFEEIDNEIDAHISALRHQEAQPSTSCQQLASSSSASNQSIEERLKRLEAAQNGNPRNVNVYEEIDNEINRQIAEHWLRHYSKDRSSPTPLQTTVSCQLPNVSYATPSSQLFTEELRRRNKTWIPRPKFSPGTFRPYCILDTLGTISGEGTSTASQVTNTASQGTNSGSQGTQSTQETLTSEDADSAEAQASEIFGKDLVQKVVQKRLTATGKRFYTVEELCDEILKHEESKPTPVEEGSRKDVPEELLCKICLDKRLSIVFEPCGHLATCRECSKPLTKCPMCRTIVRKKMRVYM